MKDFTRVCFCFILLFFGACGSSKLTSIQSLNKDYENAVKDAIYRDAKNIDTNLIVIAASNTDLKRKLINGTEHVLVVTWVEKQFQFTDSGSYKTNAEIWVTAVPELLQRMQNIKEKNKNIRLRQLLGLTPTEQDKYFIEFWVNTTDLFRPCPDKEITDNKCNLCFTMQDSLDMNHVQWMNNNWLNSYFKCGLYSQYPWTGLGYTYDWNPKNKTHKGLSEFLVRKNSTIYLNRERTTENYLTEPF
jgi:hypothetical protein